MIQLFKTIQVPVEIDVEQERAAYRDTVVTSLRGLIGESLANVVAASLCCRSGPEAAKTLGMTKSAYGHQRRAALRTLKIKHMTDAVLVVQAITRSPNPSPVSRGWSAGKIGDTARVQTTGA